MGLSEAARYQCSGGCALHQATCLSQGLGRYPEGIVMNRRLFLKVATGGVAAAAAAVAPAAALAAAASASKPKRKLRKAIMYSTIGVKGSVLEKFRAMKEAGFEG